MKSNVSRFGVFFEVEAVSKSTGFDDGSSSSWSLWGNNNSTSNGNTGSMSYGIGDIESEILKTSEVIQGCSISVPTKMQTISSGLGLSYGNGSEGVNMGLYEMGLRMKTPSNTSSFSGFDGNFDDFYSGGGDQSWSSASFGLKGGNSFDFRVGNAISDVSFNKPAGLCC